MVIQWLRALLRGENAIAAELRLHRSLLQQLVKMMMRQAVHLDEMEKHLMARTDDLSAELTELGAAVDDLSSRIAGLPTTVDEITQEQLDGLRSSIEKVNSLAQAAPEVPTSGGSGDPVAPTV